MYTANTGKSRVDVINIAQIDNPIRLTPIDLQTFGVGTTSVDSVSDIVAASISGALITDPGKVVFIRVSDNTVVASATVGALPDNLHFSPDRKKLVVACEGEPNTEYTIDPEGQVGVIRLVNAQGVAQIFNAANMQNAQFHLDVVLLDFNAYNNAVLDPSVRVFGPGATVAQDFEPEYVAISDDSQWAYITLQENNAIARISIADNQAPTIFGVYGLGFFDSTSGVHKLDANDKDGITIINNPVMLVPSPDSIYYYSQGGKEYLVAANEGDKRDYTGYVELAKVSSLNLDPTVFPNGATLKTTAAGGIGNLRVSKYNNDPDKDGDVDVLYAMGGRSVSVWEITNSGLSLVYDSADFLEQMTGETVPTGYNSHDATANSKDAQSPKSGPEPEGIAMGTVYGHRLLFVSLEKTGGIVGYVLDGTQPQFFQYINTRNFTDSFTASDFNDAGDLSPEGVCFISELNSPSGKALVAVANTVTGSTVLFEITVFDDAPTPTPTMTGTPSHTPSGTPSHTPSPTPSPTPTHRPPHNSPSSDSSDNSDSSDSSHSSNSSDATTLHQTGLSGFLLISVCLLFMF